MLASSASLPLAPLHRPGVDPHAPTGDDVRAEPALAAALREHHDSLCRTARQLCGNAADADDLVHDVYERALRWRSRTAKHSNPRAYLHSILRNLFIDRCRRARVRPRALPIEEAERVALCRPPSDESDRAWYAVTTDQVAAALAELPAEFRLVFELYAFERLRYGEIAARLGISPATVGTRLLRARAKLRDHLRTIAR